MKRLRVSYPKHVATAGWAWTRTNARSLVPGVGRTELILLGDPPVPTFGYSSVDCLNCSRWSRPCRSVRSVDVLYLNSSMASAPDRLRMIGAECLIKLLKLCLRPTRFPLTGQRHGRLHHRWASVHLRLECDLQP